MQLNPKQVTALELFEGNETSEILFGGAAGGGKSVILAYIILKMVLRYAGCRIMLGRSKLDTLKKTTLVSFWEVCAMQGITSDMYNYNQQSNTITFFNGSQIILKDLFAYPSDPNFDSLGSLETTANFIDEVAQITEKAKNIAKSRIRYRLDHWDIHGELTGTMQVLKRNKQGIAYEWLNSRGEITQGLTPRQFMSCNPFKGWGYSAFYKPAMLGKLPKDKAFIASFVHDNAFISKHYEANLNNLDELSRQRLLLGNWEYDDDLTKLFEYNRIIDIYTNKHVLKGHRRIVADIARFGNDSTVIGLWSGMRCEKIITLKKKNNAEVAAEIEMLAMKNDIHMDNVIVDSDGNGSGVMDILGCIGFVNNSRPLNDEGKETYKNLKSQCYFYAAEVVNKANMYVNCGIDENALLTEELETIREHNPDKDSKRQVEPKDKIKEVIGRSPDYSDMICMAMWHPIYKGVGMADSY